MGRDAAAGSARSSGSCSGAFFACLLLLAWPASPCLGNLLDGVFHHEHYVLTRDLCLRLSGGHEFPSWTVASQSIQAWLDLGQPGQPAMPVGAVDTARLTTLLLMMAPALRVAVDPLLYLQVLPRDQQSIPRLIHMTVPNKHQVMPHQVTSMVSWGQQFPDYALLLYDDADIQRYIELYFAGFLPAFKALATPVERADAWRYHVLCGHGGIYADTDTIAVKGFKHWAPDFRRRGPPGPPGPGAGDVVGPFGVAATKGGAASAHSAFIGDEEAGGDGAGPGLIVGLENAFRTQREAEDRTYADRLQVVQWVMAARAQHPVVCSMGAAIQRFQEEERRGQQTAVVERGYDASVLLRTGPGAWTRGVHAHIATLGGDPDRLVGGGRLGDLVVLPQTSFGCNAVYWDQRAVDAMGPTAPLVYHMYNNSWKRDNYNVAHMRIVGRQRRQRETLYRVVLPTTLVTCLACAGCFVAYTKRQQWLPLLLRRRRGLHGPKREV